MNKIILIAAVVILSAVSSFAQGFKVKASGEHTFDFTDKGGRNQATFFSTTPLEDINGLTNDIKGNVTFNVNNLNTLRGRISVSVASIKTGIDLRDEHLRSDNWLNAGTHPTIIFSIKSVSNIRSLAENKLQADIKGDFTLHGVTKEITADATLTFLDESEKTKSRAPGDLLGVQAKFSVKLPDFGINNKIVGQKVAEIVEVGVNMIGSNAN